MKALSTNLYTGAQADSSTLEPQTSICNYQQTVLPPGGDGEVTATIYPQAAANLASETQTSYFLIEDKSGTIYTFNGLAGQSEPNVNGPVVEMEDKNGNYISFPGPNGAAWIDTMGRSGPVLSGGAPPTSIVVDNLTYTAAWSTVSVNYNVTETGGGGSPVSCVAFPTNVSGTKTVLTSLTLPNNQTYQFFYGNYGLLSEIIFPDGGWIKYTWQMSPQPYELASLGGFEVSADGPYIYTPVSYGCNWNYTVPVLATRTVSFDGTTTAQAQTFSFSTTWSYNGSLPNGWTQKTATVYTTDQKVSPNVTSETVYTYIPWGVPAMPYANNNIANDIPLENTITYYDWGQSSPSKMITKSWSAPHNSPKLASETTQLYGAGGASRTSETVYSYTSGLCSNPALSSFVYPTEQDDYDFGSGGVGPLKKKTIYGYACFAAAHVATYANFNSGPPNNQWGSSYQGVVLPPQLSSITIEDGSGNVQAETVYGYDGSSLSSVSAGQFDTNYGTSMNIRSNLTSATQCTASFGSSCTGPATTYTYDITGQVASMTDPKGNKTTLSFADCFIGQGSSSPTNGYLTTITYPTVNGVTPQEKYCYSYPLGYLTESIDENNQPTTFAYADVLNRLTLVTYPDGGQTTYSYNDSAGTTTSSRLLNQQNALETNVVYRDGLFHTIETQLTTDPGGTDTVNITVDGEGHVYQRSNPYRGSGTDGTTIDRFDAFGRPIETIEQDGSTAQTCYNGLPSSPAVYCSGLLGSTSGGYGTWVDTTDGVGNHSQRVSDGFGRLIQVMEPNGVSQSASMETDYQYDTLNDLTEVDQFGGSFQNSAYADRKRTFTYDSISRLLSGTNPESGQISYTYDLNSNVVTKISGAVNGQSGTQTIGYCYDALNRITYKFYTASFSCTSPSGYAASYTYDTSGVSGATNTIGKLTDEKSYAVSTLVAERQPYSYDQMGRLLSENQFTLANLGGTPYTPSYRYDLAGNMTASTDGATQIQSVNTQFPCTVNPSQNWTTLATIHCYDGAGHEETATSNWASFPTTLFSPGSSTAEYRASGQLQNWNLGPNLSVTQGYTNRFWTNSISAMGQVP